MSNPFTHPVRVYYEDTDAAGIVYHARYLHFAERARTEMLRAVGFDHATLLAEHDLVFAVHHCDVRFLKPAKLDDALQVQCIVQNQQGARLTFHQRILKRDDLICDIHITLAVLSAKLRPKRPPATLIAAFSSSNLE